MKICPHLIQGDKDLGQSDNEHFADLMQAGRTAFAAGKKDVAHDLWKEAALVSPQNEQVWQVLLDVVENDEDRLVCLQNILQINPLNVQARRQLNKLDAQMQRQEQVQAEQNKRERRQRRRRRGVLARALVIGVAIGLSGVFFAIVISILLYGR